MGQAQSLQPTPPGNLDPTRTRTALGAYGTQHTVNSKRVQGINVRPGIVTLLEGNAGPVGGISKVESRVVCPYGRRKQQTSGYNPRKARWESSGKQQSSSRAQNRRMAARKSESTPSPRPRRQRHDRPPGRDFTAQGRQQETPASDPPTHVFAPLLLRTLQCSPTPSPAAWSPPRLELSLQ